ncbi:acyltransferase [Clostridium sp. A1-XYC3]|uniref:Acyltransferase n=1 Tax=Clostridium tanneri TaxID=3037988 RepID=A0ABU4JPA0_9CLOT|nr:acyltransferase [Clostridium sp. A1-XYC3]MDW8799982.1 acyltransferase [Clostridium sp. A1-XYC3]
MVKKRILSMDILRALAIIAVILIHVSALMLGEASFNSKVYMQSLIINQLSRFSVPAFIALSGVGLTMTYKENQGYFKFLTKRLYKIVPRYILWCAIYVFFITKTFDIYTLSKDVIFGRVFYHLYYVPLIVEFYLVFPFIYRFIGSKVGLLISFIITSVILIGSHQYLFPENWMWFLERKNMLDWIFYFSLGTFIGNNLEEFSQRLQKYKIVFSIIFVAAVSGFVYEVILNTNAGKNLDYTTTFLRPSVLIFTVALIFFIFSIDWKDNLFTKIMQYLSINSYGIYLSHAFILYYFTKYYTDNNIPIASLNYGIKGFLITLFGAVVINASRKLP